MIQFQNIQINNNTLLIINFNPNQAFKNEAFIFTVNNIVNIANLQDSSYEIQINIRDNSMYLVAYKNVSINVLINLIKRLYKFIIIGK